jgi:hypothetical protein
MKLRRIITLVSCIFIIGFAVGYLWVEWMYEPWIPMTQDIIATQIRSSYDFRDTDAYRNLVEEDKMRLAAAHHDFILLWGALDKYAYDHNGLLPSSLEGLVPDYLHSLPKDPFVDESNMPAEANEGKQSSKEAFSYRYRPGHPSNRAWIISSVGLPDFPYQSANGNGLYIIRGIWMSGINPLWMKPKALYRRR